MARMSGATALSAGPLERVEFVLDFHQHGLQRCAAVILEPVDGCPALECCIPVGELLIGA
ncbi:hypothetical protein [Rhodococcus aetherivorans]|uniref:hypothetical protein n=1 Tax=Rhodococcus aetherivorans TaxID=191292 RepID=UPI0026ED6BA0|nr:hypothetical protein [Rhodococcus aetherivorans]